MSLTKKALSDKIKRRFGFPKEKVELDDSQIYDAIDYARDKWMKWAVGQATHEIYFTVMLLAGLKVPSGYPSIIPPAFAIQTYFANHSVFGTSGK